MATIQGDRNQISLLPPSIEDYVPPDDPVRAYDAFFNQINLAELGIEFDPQRAGAPEFDPRSMLKLLAYGYAYGFRSSRKLERATHHNLSFIWLIGGIKPDHKTIARFRQRNKKALRNVLKQVVRLCIKLKLINGNTLFVDGSKVKANASLEHTWTDKKCQHALAEVDQRIDQLLTECETTDNAEAKSESLVHMHKDLSDAEGLKAKIQEIAKELKDSSKKSINTTDPDCNKVKGRSGVSAGYNMQSVVEDTHGLVVHTDVVTDNHDKDQFANQVQQAEDNVNQECEHACADAGYAKTDELKVIDDNGTNVIVPSQKQATHKPPSPFDKAHFSYDSANDIYICPEGQTLTYRSTNHEKNKKKYLVTRPRLCQTCPHFGVCTKSPSGRAITRLVNEEVKKKIEAHFLTPQAQAIFKRRKCRVEHPFGHLKWNLGYRNFLLRGLMGVRAEAALMFTGFNLTRIISILGVRGVIRGFT